jgi:iron-sulfur cluster repair protein YtfE (RIC family)
MNFGRRVPNLLHDEHIATMSALEKLEGLLGRHRLKQPPPAGNADVAAVLGQVAAALSAEMTTHFAFEEEALFPVLAARGEADIGELLAEEHAAILPLGQQVAAMATRGRREGFSPATWAEFHQLSAELVERLVSHVQKEELSLLAMLDDVLEDEDDQRLAEEFAMRR